MGTKYNHACGIGRSPKYTNLIQVGIRSMIAVKENTFKEKGYILPIKLWTMIIGWKNL